MKRKNDIKTVISETIIIIGFLSSMERIFLLGCVRLYFIKFISLTMSEHKASKVSLKQFLENPFCMPVHLKIDQ